MRLRKDFVFFGIICLVLLLSSSLAFAVGIAPSVRQVDYVEGGQAKHNFLLINTGTEEIIVEVSEYDPYDFVEIFFDGIGDNYLGDGFVVLNPNEEKQLYLVADFSNGLSEFGEIASISVKESGKLSKISTSVTVSSKIVVNEVVNDEEKGSKSGVENSESVGEVSEKNAVSDDDAGKKESIATKAGGFFGFENDSILNYFALFLFFAFFIGIGVFFYRIVGEYF